MHFFLLSVSYHCTFVDIINIMCHAAKRTILIYICFTSLNKCKDKNISCISSLQCFLPSALHIWHKYVQGVPKKMRHLFSFISLSILMLQLYALYGFVLHIETCRRDKRFRRYLQNHFENRILKFLYFGLCTIQENLQIHEIIRLRDLGSEVMIRKQISSH